MICLPLAPPLCLHSTHPSSGTITHEEVLTTCCDCCLAFIPRLSRLSTAESGQICSLLKETQGLLGIVQISNGESIWYCFSYLLFTRILLQLSIQDKQIYLQKALPNMLNTGSALSLAWHPLVWEVPSLSTIFQPASLPAKIPPLLGSMPNVGFFTNSKEWSPLEATLCSSSTDSQPSLIV